MNTITLGRLVVATGRTLAGAPRLDQAQVRETVPPGRSWAGVAVRLWGTRIVTFAWRGWNVHDRHLHPVRYWRAGRAARRFARLHPAPPRFDAAAKADLIAETPQCGDPWHRHEGSCWLYRTRNPR
jgi:hypothetical protein